MSSLPLQPIEWREYGNINGTSVDAITPICEYDIYLSNNEPSYIVAYYNRHTEAPTKEATGFATIDEAKAWAWRHYNEKMQPYVKPAPTWIDASERLPEEDGLYLAYYPDQLHKQQIVFFSLNINKFNYFHDLVKHWRPLPNPPKGE